MKSNTKNTSRFYIFFMRFIVQYRLTDDSPKFASFYLLGIELKVHLVGQNVFLSVFSSVSLMESFFIHLCFCAAESWMHNLLAVEVSAHCCHQSVFELRGK